LDSTSPKRIVALVEFVGILPFLPQTAAQQAGGMLIAAAQHC